MPSTVNAYLHSGAYSFYRVGYGYRPSDGHQAYLGGGLSCPSHRPFYRNDHLTMVVTADAVAITADKSWWTKLKVEWKGLGRA